MALVGSYVYLALGGVVAFLLYAVFCVAKLVYTWTSNMNYMVKQGMPIIEERHWFWGHLHVTPGATGEGMDWLLSMAKRYRGCFILAVGPQPVVHLCEPNSIKTALHSTAHKIWNGIGNYRFLQPWLGEGLLTSDGAKWRRNRRLLTPAFHFNILKPYMKVYNQAADVLVGKIAAAKDSGSYEIFTPVSLCTLDIILGCAFSYHGDVQIKGENHPYVQCVTEMATQLLMVMFNLFCHLPFVYQYMKEYRSYLQNCEKAHAFTEEIIEKRKQSLKTDPDQTKRRYLDFLDILLTARDENGEGLTSQEIGDEADTFLFEGHDTTASAISWILYSLAKHPEHQRKCQEEIDAILAGRDSDDIEWDDLPKLTYLTQCIKEGMRLHSPVPNVARTTDKPLRVHDVIIPTETVVELDIWAMHNNPDVWGEDAGEYKPERFTPENLANRASHDFLPFSAGPRNCIGQNFAMNEEKTVIAKILRSFNFELDQNHQVVYVPELVMRAKHGIKIHFTERNLK